MKNIPFPFVAGGHTTYLEGELVKSFTFKGKEWVMLRTNDQNYYGVKLENVPALHKPTKPEDWL